MCGLTSWKLTIVLWSTFKLMPRFISLLITIFYFVYILYYECIYNGAFHIVATCIERFRECHTVHFDRDVVTSVEGFCEANGCHSCVLMAHKNAVAGSVLTIPSATFLCLPILKFVFFYFSVSLMGLLYHSK